jgi:hypothetical protein
MNRPTITRPNSIRLVRVASPAPPGQDASGLCLQVLATTPAGTRAALRTAGRLACGLNARVSLLFAQVVPRQLPITRPPVDPGHTEHRLLTLVNEAALDAEEVAIQIYRCRDRCECLRRVLPNRSWVVLGGRRRLWPTRESELAASLYAMGHEVIFVDEKGDPHARSVLRPHRRRVLDRLLGLHQGL